jgi:hypothetical protein
MDTAGQCLARSNTNVYVGMFARQDLHRSDPTDPSMLAENEDSAWRIVDSKEHLIVRARVGKI